MKWAWIVLGVSFGLLMLSGWMRQKSGAEKPGLLAVIGTYGCLTSGTWILTSWVLDL